MVGLFSVRVYYLSLPDIQPATSYNQNICGEAPQPTVSAQYNLVPTVGPPVWGENPSTGRQLHQHGASAQGGVQEDQN